MLLWMLPEWVWWVLILGGVGVFFGILGGVFDPAVTWIYIRFDRKNHRLVPGKRGWHSFFVGVKNGLLFMMVVFGYILPVLLDLPPFPFWSMVVIAVIASGIHLGIYNWFWYPRCF